MTKVERWFDEAGEWTSDHSWVWSQRAERMPPVARQAVEIWAFAVFLASMPLIFLSEWFYEIREAAKDPEQVSSAIKADSEDDLEEDDLDWSASMEDLDKLARRAAAGDLVAARRLVAVLEGRREGSASTWIVTLARRESRDAPTTFRVVAEDEDDLWRKFLEGEVREVDAFDDLRIEYVEAYSLSAVEVGREVFFGNRIEEYVEARRKRDAEEKRKAEEEAEKVLLRALAKKHGVSLVELTADRARGDEAMVESSIEAARAEAVRIKADPERFVEYVAGAHSIVNASKKVCNRCGGRTRISVDKGDWEDCPVCVPAF